MLAVWMSLVDHKALTGPQHDRLTPPARLVRIKRITVYGQSRGPYDFHRHVTPDLDAYVVWAPATLSGVDLRHDARPQAQLGVPRVVRKDSVPLPQRVPFIHAH